jgi:HSP20 family protein
MSNLIRRNRPAELASATQEPFRLMRDLLAQFDPFAGMSPMAGSGQASFEPHFEVKETKDAYVFKADLPGVEDKDIDVSITGNRLVISGKREAEHTEEDDTYYAYERSYGSFSRSFTVPEGADLEACNAELRNGVLAISVPKRAELQPRKISLKSIGDKVKGALGAKDKGSA